MKIISSENNKDGKRIVCEDAVFDPYLAKLIDVDKDEMMILLKYDALETGRPLGITFLPVEAELIVKLTPTGIHTSMLISEFGDDAASELAYEEYGNGLGSIEFNVRMTDSEKVQLMQRIAILLLGRTE